MRRCASMQWTLRMWRVQVVAQLLGHADDHSFTWCEIIVKASVRKWVAIYGCAPGCPRRAGGQRSDAHSGHRNGSSKVRRRCMPPHDPEVTFSNHRQRGFGSDR